TPQKNFFPRYRHSRVPGQLLNRVHELRMFFIEWFEFVEPRIDDQRADKDKSEKDGQRCKPEVQPPAPGASPHHRKQNQNENEREEGAQQFLLRPIPEPRAPPLHRLFITQGQKIPKQRNRKTKKTG